MQYQGRTAGDVRVAGDGLVVAAFTPVGQAHDQVGGSSNRKMSSPPLFRPRPPELAVCTSAPRTHRSVCRLRTRPPHSPALTTEPPGNVCFSPAPSFERQPEGPHRTLHCSRLHAGVLRAAEGPITVGVDHGAGSDRTSLMTRSTRRGRFAGRAAPLTVSASQGLVKVTL